jgi:hypothetical protein
VKGATVVTGDADSFSARGDFDIDLPTV